MKVTSRHAARAAATAAAACALFAGLASTSAHARTFAEIYAECGIGAMLFNSDPGADSSARTLAVISNATWDSGTTAISSDATSEENCEGNPSTTASLMLQTLPGLERDVARGEGEYLDAVFGAAGCETDARPALTGALRTSLAESAAGDADAPAHLRAAALYDGLAAGADELPGSCAI